MRDLDDVLDVLVASDADGVIVEPDRPPTLRFGADEVEASDDPCPTTAFTSIREALHALDPKFSRAEGISIGLLRHPTPEGERSLGFVAGPDKVIVRDVA